MQIPGYSFKETEHKWQNFWHATKSYVVPENPSSPYYVLEQFPYPSGRLHMGHVRVYTLGDTIARFKRAFGHTVLHPMGWDSFGLPAENAAIQHGVSPLQWTLENIVSMKKHFQKLGLSYDWSREIITSDVSYYGHEQKIFLDFYKNNLIYRKESWVNWDPVEQTVLANEQVVNGKGWRSGAPVERRLLSQWFLKITHFADKLLTNLKDLDKWPDNVRTMQEKWIGKSVGANIRFPLIDPPSFYPASEIDVFSTRPDTLFGASFIALAPNHPLSLSLSEKNPSLASFIQECLRQDTSEATLQKGKKKGFATGLFVEHPFKVSVKLPVYVANFVMMEYGTGAIFGCPAHDNRDLEFARLYNLPILPVVKPKEGVLFSPKEDTDAYMGDGVLIHSEFLDGLSVKEAQEKAIERLEASHKGSGSITYRLRDWGVSRQRYWGCPIPMIHCTHCGVVPVPEKDLPISLPEDVSFDKPGNPLDHHPSWKHVACPVCNKDAVRETDTLDTFFESSWYFLRFCSPHAKLPFNKKEVETLMPVDMYVGGVEHAVLHLLYSRFFCLALKECNYLDFEEPFTELLTQGFICHETYQDLEGNWLYPEEVIKHKDGTYVTLRDQASVRVGRSEKMSKSRKNVIDPSLILQEYGADTARLFMLSDTPPDRNLDWSDGGIEGCWRYINRLWRLIHTGIEHLKALEAQDQSPSSEHDEKFRRVLHHSIKFVTDAYEQTHFNTAVAQLRTLSNELASFMEKTQNKSLLHESLQTLVHLFFPIIPHITSELWEILTHKQEALDFIPWPKADPAYLEKSSTSLTIQVNGKMRGVLSIAKDTSEEDIKHQALSLPAVKRDLENLSIKRVIYVPNRIMNLVAS